MDMQLMLGIGVLCYFITLVLICLYKDRINVKVGNAIFILVDAILYLVWNISYAEKGWLDNGFMTFANISPFIFTLIPLTIFMKDKIRDYAYSAIAFLHLGLFLATLISPEYVVIFDYKTEATFAYAAEAMCHVWAALFGLYLILTKQVEISFKGWVRSIVFMLSVVSFGVMLNLILDTHCFNMNPNDYSIYMLDIFGSFEATLAAYYLGIVVVLTLGMQSGYGLVRLVDKIYQHHDTDAAAVTLPASETVIPDAHEEETEESSDNTNSETA